MSKLNEIQIKALKSQRKPYELSDGEGLFLHVNTNGIKSWRCKFKYKGRNKLIGLGVYPDISLSDARSKLLESRNRVINITNRIDESI